MNSPVATFHIPAQLKVLDRELIALLERYRHDRIFDTPPRTHSKKESADRLISGKILCEPEAVVISHDICSNYGLDLLRFFQAAIPENEEGFTYIKDTFVAGEMNCADFLRDVFCEYGTEFDKATHHFGLRRDLVELFAVYFTRPFRAEAARLLTSGIDLSLWQRGYCPVCGHLPVIARALGKDSRKRDLWCVHCETVWSISAAVCPFCSKETIRPQELFIPSLSKPVRVYICSCCDHCLKEALTDFLSMDGEFFLSRVMDEPIHSQGYLLEPLLKRAT
jgi:hypothetical protein